MSEHETSAIFPVPCLEDPSLHKADVPADCDVELIVSSAGAAWVVPLFSGYGDTRFALGYKSFAPKEPERLRTRLS